MKKTLIAGAVLAASMFSASAMANVGGDTGYYLWGDVGTSHTTDYDKAFDNADQDLDGNMYGMGLGISFGDNLFAEMGYQSLGTSEFSGSEGPVIGDDMKNEHSAVVVRLGKVFTWNPHVAFSVHLGGAHVESETSGSMSIDGGVTYEGYSEKETQVIGMAGVGMNFNITENLDARVRFERMIGVESAYDNYHMDNLTAGIVYRL